MEIKRGIAQKQKEHEKGYGQLSDVPIQRLMVSDMKQVVLICKFHSLDSLFCSQV
jgi:hypothetical protein